jgi:predicted protein tyrosine phosphatase
MSTAVKKIKYFSVVDFKNFMKSLGYISYDYNRRIPYNDIPRQDFAVISIGNVEWLPDADKNNDLWANGTNTHWLPGIYDNVLNIEFSDTGEGDFEAMSVEQGKEIVDFVKKNKDKNNFYIHCSAGISRSGAVASFIYDYFKENGNDVVMTPHYPETPNYHVKNTLKRILRYEQEN